MDMSFILVGGELWLNLSNTVFMSNGEKRDILKDKELILEWLSANGLINDDVDAIQNLIAKGKFDQELVKLRSLFFSLLNDIDNENTISKQSFSLLKNWLESIRIYASAELQEEGTVRETYKGHTLRDDILFQIGISAVKTLETIPLERIRKCEHQECILHFVDTSKGGKRRWCSMETCGNRYKASKFYAKKKKGTH